MGGGRLRGVAAAAAAMLVATLLIGAQSAVSADPVEHARGRAWGVSESLIDVKTPEVEVAVPPTSAQHDEETLVDVLDLVEVAHVAADACKDAGAPATLQQRVERARYLAGGGDPGGTEPAAQRAPVQTPAGFPSSNRCVTPVGGSPSPVPTDTAGPTPTDTVLPPPTVAPPPPAGTNCEDFDAGAPVATCDATLPLWNARGYTKLLQVLDTFKELESEALGRCVGTTAEFATAVRYELLGALQADPDSPNQPLDPLALGLARTAAVEFWDTNWDPNTMSTTDGSDTVHVNALRITTPVEEILIGHAEAEVDCPQPPTTPPTTPTVTVTVTPTPPPPGPTPPPGGFPREVTLEASKDKVLFGKTFSLAGAVTPATEFATPESCVDDVDVSIQRDPIGGPEQFSEVARVRTDSEGNFSFNTVADKNAQWIAIVEKDNPLDCAQDSSEARPVLVRPGVGLRVSDKTPERGSRITFTVTVAPCGDHIGTRTKLRRQIDGSPVTIMRRRLKDGCKALFDIKANFKESVFDATWPKQDEDHQTGVSRNKVVRTHK